MSKTVETRTYVDGPRRIRAEVQDNGTVSIHGGTASETTWDDIGSLGADVLRELADLADKAQAVP